MALESALWGRLRDTGIPELLFKRFRVHMKRIENAVAQGHPDVEGCVCSPLDAIGTQVWIELKSEERPKRDSTPIRPKLRPSQSIWHRKRTEAGCRCHWILLQVGDGHRAKLYLIPGREYDNIKALTESKLALLSVVSPDASPADVLEQAARGW